MPSLFVIRMSTALTKIIKDFARRADAIKAPKVPQEISRIHVDEIASKVASFYERVRKLIDYREEHLLRKHYIERTLKKRLFLKNVTGAIAEPLVKDIIRAGHLPNDTVPETAVREVEAVIHNLLVLFEHLRGAGNGGGRRIQEWLAGITANAIEEILFPPAKEMLTAELMFSALKSRLYIQDGSLSDDEINLQLFIAVQRALLRVDQDLLHWRLLKFVYPNWLTMPREELPEIARNLPAIRENIERHLHHPLRRHFFKLADHYNAVFYLIGDLLTEERSAAELEALVNDEVKLASALEEAYRARYAKEKTRLGRLAFFSVISFLLSKIAVAFAIEIPVDRALGQFSLENTVINTLFAPLLMLVIVFAIRMPSEKNFRLIWEAARDVVYEGSEAKYILKIPKRRPLLGEAVVRLFYAAVFVTVFWWLAKLLLLADFSPASIVIFAFFVSLVAATGVKVHNRAQEISLEEAKPTVLSFLMDLVAMPFISVGRVALAGLAKVNILVVVVNLLIELPFTFFVEFLENFRAFIKAQKEEIT